MEVDQVVAVAGIVHVQRMWLKTEEGGGQGKLRGQCKFHFCPRGGGMSISSERVFDQEEVAIETRNFLSLTVYSIPHYRLCGTPLMLCWYSLSFPDLIHIDYQGPPLQLS